MSELRQAPKAYNNPPWLNSPPARALRILAEYLEPEDRLEKETVGDIVVFFGSARIRSRKQAQARLEELWAKVRSGGEESDGLGAGSGPPERTGEEAMSAEDPPTEAELERARSSLAMSRYYEQARELAFKLAQLGQEIPPPHHFNIATGGGPGIMEAANRGAAEAGARTIGFNISLPHEQDPNPYISPELNFEFHYFFMRKLWFAYPCHAVVVFPGGYGTLDELFEMLTLIQNGKSKPIPVVLYGREYWDDVLDLKALARWGTISEAELALFKRCDTVEEAYRYLEGRLRP